MTGFELWVVEYSVQQDCFNIDTLNSVLRTNMNSAMNKVIVDYKILCICNSYEEANNRAKELRKEINDNSN